MNEIKIEKDIPAPEVRATNKYPFHKLEVGDSFFVEGKNSGSISGCVGGAKKKHPDRKFISRTVDGGVRVWRIA